MSRVHNILVAIGIALVAGCSSDTTVEEIPVKRTFGHRQLEQLLADRPDMQGVLPDDSLILQWVIDSFDGERLGQRIYWQADSPHSGSASECSPPYQSYPPFVRVTGGTEVTPIDKWAALIFEIYNLGESEGHIRVWQEAMAGKLTSHDYAMQCVEVEYRAMQKTSTFLKEHPLPQSEHDRDIYYQMMVDAPETFELMCEQYEAAGSTPGNYDYFKNNYEEDIAPYLNQISNSKPSTFWSLFQNLQVPDESPETLQQEE